MSENAQDLIIVLQEQLANEHLRNIELEKELNRVRRFLLDLVADAGSIFKALTLKETYGGDKESD